MKPHLLALAVERPVLESDRWTVGVRASGQTGTVDGAYTCPASVLPFAPGSPNNLYGCQAESADTATLRYVGAEVSAAHRSAGHKWSPHVGVGVNYLDVAFQVRAFTFGFEDTTHYTSHGLTVNGIAGVSYPLTARLGASFDVFYSPLSVQRPTGSEIDPFVNVRAMLTYQLRK